jgi:peptidoglycan/LPS O-acetylase OafA/YrhL
MNLTMTQSLFADNALSLNYPGWSLSVECCFYLLFPQLFSFLIKKTSKVLIIGCSLFWVFSMVMYGLSMDVFGVSSNYTTYFPAYHLSTFVLGIGAGLIYCRHKEILNQSKTWLTLSTLALAAISAAMILLDCPVIKYHHGGLFNPLFLATILLFAIDRAPLKALLSSRPMVLLGEVSYGIYILQYSLWCLFFKFGSQFNIPALFNFYVCLGGLTGCSVFFYYLIEMPPVKFVKAAGRRLPLRLPGTAVIQLPRGYGMTTDSLVRVTRN